MAVETTILIIGGGPSGSLAGIWALRNGLKCMIVDKADFPRNKLCAGLITAKTAGLLHEITGLDDISHLYNIETTKVACYFQKKPVVRFNTNEPFFLTYRKHYDYELLKIFLSLGGSFLKSSVSVKDIDVESKTLTTDSETIHFEYLFGADGAVSVVRKLIDPQYFPNLISLETEVPFEHLPNHDREEIILYTGLIPHGYGWVFPKADGFTIGLAGDLKKPAKIHDYYKTFLAYTGITQIPEKTHGAWLPCGKLPKKAILDSTIFLLGDAAGLTDPLKGEGLYYAAFSGKAAVDAVLREKNNLASAPIFYQTKLNEAYSMIREGYFLKKLIFNPIVEPWIFRKVTGHHRIVKYYTDNLVSQYNYRYKQIIKLIRDYRRLKKEGKLT